MRIGIGLGLIPSAARPTPTTAPVNVVKPSFDGVLTQGQSAGVNPGSWTGLPSPNFTYAIKRGATTISTDPAYVWTSADVAAGAGAMTVAVTATNDIGPTTETSDPATIVAPLALSGTAPAGNVGAPYSFTPTRTGGHSPFAFALVGTLPTGLSFSSSTGAITGTPVASGTADLTIAVMDGDGLTAALGPFNLEVTSLPAPAPLVSNVLSVVGDSWTEGNEAKISRSPPTVTESDRWDYQLAALLGVTNYTTPGQTGVTAGVINVGYGGQTSGQIYQNLKAILVANPARLDDAFTFWAGRNDVTKPGTDKWPTVTDGAYSVTVTANLTNGSTSVTNVSPSFASLGNLNGVEVSGTGVQAGSFINGDASGTGFTLSQQATASGTGVTLTLTARGADDFLALIPHNRKVVMTPYGGGAVTASNNDWIRWNRLKWSYRRNYRKHLFEPLHSFMGLSPNGSDGGSTDNADVAIQSLITSKTRNSHPNYLASPLIAAAMLPLARALQNKGVFVMPQSIPDVPRDMAAGQTIEVYFKGYVTGCSIAVDDPTYPGLFTIAMKAASNDTALLTRTTTSPGVIPQILNLQIKADGLDTAGAAKTHTGPVRILPSVIGAASTLPVGATIPRDPNATAAIRRWSRMSLSASPFANNAALTFVARIKPGENDTNMNIVVADVQIIINRNSSNRLAIVVRDSAGAVVLNWTTQVTDFNVAGGYTWVAFSINLATLTAIAYSGRNAADVNISAGSAPTAGTGLIGLASDAPHFFAASSTGASSFSGAVQSIWMDTRFIDFSNAVNRRKFWNTDGSPVDLGADGSTGLTSPPAIYLRGAPGDWLTGKNFGTGPDFGTHDTWLSGQASSDPLLAA